MTSAAASSSAAKSMFGELLARLVANTAPLTTAKKLGFPTGIFDCVEGAESLSSDLDIRALGAQVRFQVLKVPCLRLGLCWQPKQQHDFFLQAKCCGLHKWHRC